MCLMIIVMKLLFLFLYGPNPSVLGFISPILLAPVIYLIITLYPANWQ